jgi:hypothetical protein
MNTLWAVWCTLKDLSLALNLKAASSSSSDSSYSQSMTLNSPMFSTSSPSCLMLTYVATADVFEVNLACVDARGIYTKKLLHRYWPGVIARELTSVRQSMVNLSLNIDAIRPSYEACSVQFNITDSKSHTAAVFKMVQITTGQCQPVSRRERFDIWL